jgi:orotidine-5'-phosphate decarboxylase
MAPESGETAQAVEEFLFNVIDLVSDDVAIVKPQISLFERLGEKGLTALRRVCAHARERGLLVLLDAKRGDIADTAFAYAQTYLGGESTFAVDAMTVNPYLGPDSIEPFLIEAERRARGVVVLVRNSNQGSSEYQAIETIRGPFFQLVAASLSSWQDRLANGRTGWSSLGVTVAATHPADTDLIRSTLPNCFFLVLGYGAQGASAADAVRGFRRGPAGLEGGVVSTSRRILFPTESQETTATAWQQGVRRALRTAIDELGEVIA